MFFHKGGQIVRVIVKIFRGGCQCSGSVIDAQIIEEGGDLYGDLVGELLPADLGSGGADHLGEEKKQDAAHGDLIIQVPLQIFDTDVVQHGKDGRRILGMVDQKIGGRILGQKVAEEELADVFGLLDQRPEGSIEQGCFHQDIQHDAVFIFHIKTVPGFWVHDAQRPFLQDQRMVTVDILSATSLDHIV